MIVMTAPMIPISRFLASSSVPWNNRWCSDECVLTCTLDNSAPRTSAAISEAPGRTQSEARAYSHHASRRPLLMTSWCELAADPASPAPGDPPGRPGKFRRTLTPEDQASIQAYADRYVEYSETYKAEAGK